MIDWTNVKRTVKPLVARLCDITLTQVQWKDEPASSAWTNAPTVYLTIKDVAEIGIDEERRQANGNDDMTITVCGQRRFTLQVECESFQGPIDEARNAAAVLSRLKTRLRRSSTIETLHGIFGVETWTPARKIDYVANDRAISKYVLDLHCVTVDNDDDSTAGAGGFINEVLIDGTLTDGGTLTFTPSLDVKGT